MDVTSAAEGHLHDCPSFAGMAYTLASAGPPIHFMVPTVFAGLIGFLSNLAIAECHGIIMETYDTSDLQPGMTGKPRNDVPESVRRREASPAILGSPPVLRLRRPLLS
jgi:hypothetical protein